MNLPGQSRMTPTALKKMIELQARETAREQALGIAAQFLSNLLRGNLGTVDVKDAVDLFFSFSDNLRPRLTEEIVTAKMAEVLASTETEEVAN
jgi:hypothetical protein